jgi:hypothetical protein
MNRRLTSLLIVWFTLFSVTAPALACVSATPHGDCCPEQGTPPCGECPDETPARDTSPNHCLTAPAQVAQAGAMHEQPRKVFEADLQPSIVSTVPLVFPSQSAAAEPVRPRWRATHDDHETPTYLATGRLRL